MGNSIFDVPCSLHLSIFRVSQLTGGVLFLFCLLVLNEFGGVPLVSILELQPDGFRSEAHIPEEAAAFSESPNQDYKG